MFEFIFSSCHQWCCKPTLCMRMPCPPHLAGSAVSCKPGRLCSTRSSHAARSFSGSPPHDDSATATPLLEPSWCYTTSTWGCRVGISRIWRSRLLIQIPWHEKDVVLHQFLCSISIWTCKLISNFKTEWNGKGSSRAICQLCDASHSCDDEWFISRTDQLSFQWWIASGVFPSHGIFARNILGITDPNGIKKVWSSCGI